MERMLWKKAEGSRVLLADRIPVQCSVMSGQGMLCHIMTSCRIRLHKDTKSAYLFGGSPTGPQMSVYRQVETCYREGAVRLGPVRKLAEKT
jgi:hypothetical protein